MKKAILVSIVLFIAAAVYLEGGKSVKSVTTQLSASTAHSSSAGAQPAVLEQPDPIKLNVINQAMAKAQTLDSIEHSYVNVSQKVWKRHLGQSQVAVGDLIEKSNRGTLTDKEAVTLVTEMRRQTVLVSLITRAKLEQIKRRYL